MSTILASVPSEIEAICHRLFVLEDPILLTQGEWDLYLPYIDNIWSLNMAPKHNTALGRQTAYYRCRLHAKEAWAPPNGPKRMRQRSKPSRHALGCGMKMKVVFYSEDTRVECYRHGDCLIHAHSLGESDQIKRPSAVRSLAATQVANGYKVAAVA